MEKFGFITFKDNKVAFYTGSDADLVQIVVKYNNEKLVAKVSSYPETQKVVNSINNEGVDIDSKMIAKVQASNYFEA